MIGPGESYGSEFARRPFWTERYTCPGSALVVFVAVIVIALART
jgi:hypothetical protein